MKAHTETYTRISTPEGVRSLMKSNSPTTNARRYVLMSGVLAKATLTTPGRTVDWQMTSVLEMATRSMGTVSVHWKVALAAGSSQHGKHRRASVASNCVTAMYRSSPSTCRDDTTVTWFASVFSRAASVGHAHTPACAPPSCSHACTQARHGVHAASARKWEGMEEREGGGNDTVYFDR